MEKHGRPGTAPSPEGPLKKDVYYKKTTPAPTLTPHPLTNSITLFPLTHPHLVLNMTTRSAEEASLSKEHEGHHNVHLHLGDPPNTEVAENVQEDLNVLSYVTIPSPQDLDIHGWNWKTILENLNTTQWALWTTERGNKILVYRAYAGRIEDRKVVTKLHNEIKGFVSLDANPVIMTPVPQVKGRRDAPPYCALIMGITTKKAEDLINKVCRTPPPMPTNPLTAITEVHVYPGPHSTLPTL